jgi:hypothetical protein
VYLESPDPKKSTVTGKYVINTIEYSMNYNTPFRTDIYISRDSLNDVENNIMNPDQYVKIKAVQKAQLLTEMKYARMLMSSTQQYLGGTLSSNLLGYFTSLKSQTLNSFKLNGVTLNFTSQLSALNSFMNVGRTLYLQLLNKAIPSQYRSFFDEFYNLAMNGHTSSVLNTLISTYVPSAYASFFQQLLSTIISINTSLKSTASSVSSSSNSIAVSTTNTGGTVSTDKTAANSSRISKVTNELIDNVAGLDIPVP